MQELSGLRRGDAAIIGGGLTGLLLASSLAQAGMKTLLLDTGEDRIPPCTGEVTFLCIPTYHRIRNVHGIETARQYASALMGTLSDLLCTPQDYIQSIPAYVYALSTDELTLLSSLQEDLQQLGIYSCPSPDAGDCPFPVERALTATHQLLADLSQWRAALLRNIRRYGGRIYTGSAVNSLHSTKVCTAHGCAEAPVIIFAGVMPPFSQRLPHPYLLERHLLILRELHCSVPLQSSQHPVVQNRLHLCPSPDGAIVRKDAGQCGTCCRKEPFRALETDLSLLLPDWQQASIHDLYGIFSADGLPVIGNLPGSRHLFAAGTGGTGILGAVHAASVLSRRVLGQVYPEDMIYTPDRTLPRSCIQKELQHHRAIRFRNMLRHSAPVCSNCGCRMRYNTIFSNWECPSCSSVFDMLGQVLCGPAIQESQIFARQRPDW